MALSTSWMDYRWSYRKQITITADGGVAVPSSFLAKLDISGFTTNMRPDRYDVRVFKHYGGNTWGECYIYRYDDTNFYFRIYDAIPAGSTNSNYYLYYGNVNATAPPYSSKENVFPPYLDGQTNSLYYLDGTGFDYAQGQLTPVTNLTAGSAGITYQTGPFYYSANSNGTGNAVMWQNPNTSVYCWGNDVHPLRNAQFWLNPTPGTQGTPFAFWRDGWTPREQKIRMAYGADGNAFVEWGAHNTDSNQYVGINSLITFGSWHHYGFKWYASSLQVYKDGVLFGSYPISSYPQSQAIVTLPALFGRFDGNTMVVIANASMYGVKFGRHSGEEMDASGINFEHGKRSSLPTTSLGLQEQPSGGSFLYNFL